MSKPNQIPQKPNREIMSISELNRQVKTLIEDDVTSAHAPPSRQTCAELIPTYNSGRHLVRQFAAPAHGGATMDFGGKAGYFVICQVRVVCTPVSDLRWQFLLCLRRLRLYGFGRSLWNL